MGAEGKAPLSGGIGQGVREVVRRITSAKTAVNAQDNVRGIFDDVACVGRGIQKLRCKLIRLIFSTQGKRRYC